MVVAAATAAAAVSQLSGKWMSQGLRTEQRMTKPGSIAWDGGAGEVEVAGGGWVSLLLD